MNRQASRDGQITVLWVDDGTDQALVAELASLQENLAVTTAEAGAIPERLAADAVDCVVVSGRDLATVRTLGEHDGGPPVVVRSPDAPTAERGLETGAAAVHRTAENGPPETELLARRIESVVDASQKTGEERWTTRIDRIQDGVVVLDDEWVCTYANERANRLFAPDGERLEGRDLWAAMPDARDGAFYNAAHRAFDEREQVTVREQLHGDDRWIELKIFPDETGVTVYAHDVTERKRRDESLGRLLVTTRALMAAETHSAVAAIVVDAVEKVLGYGYGQVYLVDDAGRIEPAATADHLELGHPDAELVERAFQRGSSVFSDALTGTELGSGLVLPLDDHGVLVVASADPDDFSQSDVAIAEILSANAVAALDRADGQETLERYEDVLETVQDMVFALDPAGSFTLVTDSLAERLGYDREQLEGRHVSTVLDGTDFHDGTTVAEEIASSDRESNTYETEMETADGERFPVEVEISLLPETDGDEPRGTVGAVRDRTELARTRAALETERDRFTYLFENLPDPVAEVEYEDLEPIVQNVNQAFVHTFQVQPEEIIGGSLNDYVIPPEGTGDEVAKLDGRLAAGEFVTEEIRRGTIEGIGDFLIRGIPFRTGKTTRVFAIYTDITEQKRRQRRVGVLNRVLRHNVRNEMTVIRGYSRMIADRLVGEGVARDLAEAAVELAESAATIEELSTQARRVEKVLAEDHVGELDVNRIVEAVTADYRSRYPEADIRTELADLVRVATTERIRLAIENLVENAVVHSSSDLPDVPGPTVLISTFVDGDRGVIRVSDDGPGIPEHEQAVIAGDQEVTQLEHGSGLGLWIVKWTVEGFSGHVRFAESDLGGATVELRLPRPQRDRRETRTDSAE